MLIEGSITQNGRYDAISTAFADVSTEMPLEHARDAAHRLIDRALRVSQGGELRF
jgi:hypothetical protein